MRFSSLKTTLLRKPPFSTQTNLPRKPPFSTQATIQNYSDAFSWFPRTRFLNLINSSKTACHLKQTHAQIIRHGFSQNSIIVSRLISACSLFKLIDYALSIFRQTRDPDHFIFDSLIWALYCNGRSADSISHFALMRRLSIHTSSLTFVCALDSSTSLNEYGLGGALHAIIIRLGLDLSSFIRHQLVRMYARFGFLDHSQQLFEEIPEDVFAGNLMINGYCEAGNLERASKLFEAMPERDMLSWTLMVAWFAENGDHQRALSTFYRMLAEGVKPNDSVVISALLACAGIGALDAGIWIHEYVLCNGFPINRLLGTSLVYMYSKCGKIECASQVFYQIEEKNVQTWSIMISGLANNGCCREALQCFEEMKSAGTHPDGAVFLAVLTACSLSGMVHQGLQVFSMLSDYSITPTVKHYRCIVDLLVRAGHLDKALKFIESMPIKSDFVIWSTLFRACQAHKNIEMAELASNRLLQLEPKHPGSYVFLSNLFAEARRWEDVEKVRNLMKIRGIDKPHGWSFIEVGGHVHSFIAGDRSHARTEEIYQKLEEITAYVKAQGYIPDTDGVLHNIEEEEKEDTLGSHSEKLALAFGLVSTSSPAIIRIVKKDLRVCGDCHSLMKHTSKISEREIVLRDTERFHHFKDGACTCRDYW